MGLSAAGTLCVCVCVCLYGYRVFFFFFFVMQEFALKACIEHFNVTYYSVEGGVSSTPTAQVGGGVGQQQAAGGSPASG